MRLIGKKLPRTAIILLLSCSIGLYSPQDYAYYRSHEHEYIVYNNSIVINNIKEGLFLKCRDFTLTLCFFQHATRWLL